MEQSKNICKFADASKNICKFADAPSTRDTFLRIAILK